jgi:predicted Zn-dependent peptidase
VNSSSLAPTRTHRLPNGLTVVGEPMPDKQAAAWAFLIPAGAATEPQGRDGLTSVLEGLSYRGAGNRDSRELSDALDDLGIDRTGGADTEYTSFGGATLGMYLPETLELYADIIRRPRLPEDEWEAQRELALQALQSLEDSPARKMFVQLRHVYFPNAYGRSPLGTLEGLNALTLDDLRADHAARFRPEGSILALAGNFDWDEIVARVESLFGDWQGSPPALEAACPVARPVYHHIAQETAQMHIGVAYAGVPVTDEHFYDYRVAMSVLSGGMGARLFTEVREKRGLVYSVSASPGSLRGCGFSLAYAGTTPERAQQTLDVLLGELVRVKEGVTEEEVERAKVGMLSSLVMQEESSRARASSIARDQFMLNRVRPTDEVTDAINAVTPQSIQKYFDAHSPRDFTVVTLGPSELIVPQF